MTLERFVNFLVSLRRLPPLSDLSGDEERMLFALRGLWQKSGALSVADVYDLIESQSASTSYRQLMALKDKGLVEVNVSGLDKRKREVSFTQVADELFVRLG